MFACIKSFAPMQETPIRLLLSDLLEMFDINVRFDVELVIC